MGDHFVLLVDRLITESTLEAALESRNRAMQEAAALAVNKAEEEAIKMGNEDLKSPRKIVECRICQDEDENSNMETPCSCCGSLKYAHRRCIQRWCNEKGDTICEICHQQYKPGYTAPTSLFRFGRIPMTFRGNWEISRRDLHNRNRLVRLDSTDDQYSDSSDRNLQRFRLNVALMFVILFILRRTLPVIISGDMDDSIAQLLVSVLVFAAIFLSMYLIVIAVLTFVQRHLRRRPQQQQQEPPNASVNSSGDESEQVALPSQLHVHHV